MNRTQKLWNAIDELQAVLSTNPHINIEKARKLTNEAERLVMAMRRREIEKRLSEVIT